MYKYKTFGKYSSPLYGCEFQVQFKFHLRQQSVGSELNLNAMEESQLGHVMFWGNTA